MLITDRGKLTIVGVHFKSQKAYDEAIYAISSNMIEGWKPTKEDVEKLKERMMDEHGDLGRIL